MMSLITREVGAAPEGTVTVGSLESGPLVGVFTPTVVGFVGVELDADALLLANVSSALFSLPTVIVLLEPLEPQPAIRAAVASAARPGPAQERSLGKLFRFFTAAEPTGTPGAAATVRYDRHGPC